MEHSLLPKKKQTSKLKDFCLRGNAFLSRRLFFLFVFSIVLFFLSSCKKTDVYKPNEKKDIPYVLDSIKVVEYLVRSDTSFSGSWDFRYYYNSEEKASKVTARYTYWNREYHDTMLNLSITNGDAYVNNIRIGRLSSFEIVNQQPSFQIIERTYPSGFGIVGVDSGANGYPKISRDGFGRISGYLWRSFATFTTRNANAPYNYEKRVVDNPTTTEVFNDKDGVLRAVSRPFSQTFRWVNYTGKPEDWKWNSQTIESAVRETEVARTSFKLVNAPLLFFVESVNSYYGSDYLNLSVTPFPWYFPETYLRRRTSTKGVRTDSSKNVIQESEDYIENYDIQVVDGYVKSYKQKTGGRLLFYTTYYFHKK